MDSELIPNSAKILAHLMIDDPQLRTYADIGNKAFGQRSRFFVSSLFCLELFAVGYVWIYAACVNVISDLDKTSALFLLHCMQTRFTLSLLDTQLIPTR